VGRVGNYVAFPLRSITLAPPEWRALLGADAAYQARASQEVAVTLPIPGVWLRSELIPAQVASAESGAGDAAAEVRKEKRKKP
jgi:hypothetical protein